MLWASHFNQVFLGGGVWGCALAKLLSVNNKVCIYARDEKIVTSIKGTVP